MKSFCLVSLALILLSVPAMSIAQENWHSAAIDKALQHYRINLPDGCDAPHDEIAPLATHDLPIGEDTAAREASLVQLPCTVDASVYLLVDDEGTVSDVWFLTPFVANPAEIDTEFGPARDQVRIDWTDTRKVSRPTYDESGRVLTSKIVWPVEGGAYSVTSWGFRDGRFQLMQFAVDASRNGQDDPEILFKSQLW